MNLNPESKYPNRRAYVLKLRGDATAEALAGRIENLVTGQQRANLRPPSKLLASPGSDLALGGAERPPGDAAE